jgi:predicted acyltransferase (DUF342 family)
MNMCLNLFAPFDVILRQVSNTVIIGVDSHFECVRLSQAAITMGTNASINGRLLAQTQIALDKATVTGPAQ